MSKLNIQWFQWKENSLKKTLPPFFFIVLEKGSMIWNSLVPKERTHISNKLLLFIAGVREGQSFRGEQGDSILTAR